MKKEKIWKLLLFILVLIAILSSILLKPINDLDEIWQYNFAKNIANGLVPYRDSNMLIMPLLPLICGLLLKLTINHLIVMRVLAAILCTFVIFLVYKTFRRLEIKSGISLIFTFLIGRLLQEFYCIDYNFATLLFVLIIINNEIKIYKKDNVFLKLDIKNDIFLGVLAGLALMLKQSTGVFICIALLGNKLLFVKNKEEIKIYLKIFLYRIIGIFIPISIIMLYIVYNRALSEFIDYTIKGVTGFSNYISYLRLLKFNIVGILSVLVPISFIYSWYKSIIKEENKNIYFLLVYGLAMFVVAFPISDNIHFLIGAIPAIIMLFYEGHSIFYRLYKRFVKSKKVHKLLLLIMYLLEYYVIIFLIAFCLLNIKKYIGQKDSYSNLNHYQYITIKSELENQIKKVDDYILNSSKRVKMLDATAAVYMIPIDRYNRYYDIFLKGSFGEGGNEKLIQDIKSAENREYLVLKDNYQENWQTPLEVIDYVKENKTKVGEIEIFDIYE